MTGKQALWIDPSFGASGDMLLGALLGLGVPLDDLKASLIGLGIDGWSIDQETTTRGGISANRAIVSTQTTHHHRSWSSIDALLAESDLPPAVADGARATFKLLGEIEAAQHQVALDDVHFHEVGAVDALVDIVGVWSALHLLDITTVVVGPVGIGHGTVKAAHGQLPLPAPATLALLEGAPIRSIDVELETCTPTGAALLRSIGEWGSIPNGILQRSARGAGGRDPESHPNVVTAIVVELTATVGSTAASKGGHPALVLSTNVDDVSPEILGHVIDRLLDAGADDAWIVPMSMKKNRPAHLVSALIRPELEMAVRGVLSEETGTLGIRVTATTKHPLPRSVEHVALRGAEIAIKLGPHGAKPEHDDLLALSIETGVPIRRLAEEARIEWSKAKHQSDTNP